MKHKLMIVDDEPIICNGLAEYFPWESLGFVVVARLENGRQALEYIKNFSVDVILADIRMPIMDGLEVAKYIYENNPEIKVVFLSGYRDFDYARQAIGYGVKEYIVKPAKLEKITEVFEKIRTDLIQSSTSSLTIYGDENDGYYDLMINKIKTYLNENLKSASLENTADFCNFSPGYLSKLFKQKTNKTFSDYLGELKMKKAADLLMDTSYKHYNIAEFLGYEDARNFSRAFKNYYGMSPKEYKSGGSK